jgi:hypothetical protein
LKAEIATFKKEGYANLEWQTKFYQLEKKLNELEELKNK